jgi:2-polyprenyl-3-methyl-5-hydroxy-6-metoxy-1,4-benzoquinol methylase
MKIEETIKSQNQYNDIFFKHLSKTSLSSASNIVPHVIDVIRPSSIVSVGCGIGTWLSVFAENGITDVLGMDEEHVDRSMLEIPENRFQPVDLKKLFSVDRNFDLEISLEIAEHLSAAHAAGIVELLTQPCLVILFSATMPFQGSVGHLNEQWPKYWVELFADREYMAVDYLCKMIWDDKNIQWLYIQKLFITKITFFIHC